MRKYLVIAVLLAAAVGLVTLQQRRIAALKAANESLAVTRSTLLDSVRHYRTARGLKVAEAGELRLTVAELKKYRADDWRIIQSLKTGGRDVQRLTKVEAVTRDTVTTVLRDTVVRRDTVPVQARAISIDRRWWSLHGFVAGDTLGAELEVRSSLRIVETVRYKRFLGFLWKTHKVQSRKVDVVSLNPNERIGSVEFVVVEE